MDAHIRKVYVPMTETSFYILLCLKQPNHGYGIVQTVEQMTEGEIKIRPGTMYGSLSKMEKDGLICFIREEEKRKIYQITALGCEVLELELKRIKRLYRNSMEANTMKETLKNRCDLFFENRESVKEAFKYENEALTSVCASILTNTNQIINSNSLKACKEHLQAGTSIFSNFRGAMEMPMVAMMATKNDPAATLTVTLDYYKTLKEQFSGSEYLVMAAAILADTIAAEQIGTVTARAKNLYKLMKEEHPFLTSSEDSVFAALMAISEKKDDQLLMNEAEVIYQTLKQSFSSSNDVQAVSFILALADDTAEAKCQKFISLYDALKAADAKYGKYHELTTLAALSILPVEISVMVDDILAVDACLAENKPYKGIFGVDKKTRLMHSAMLVSQEYSKSADANITAMAGTLSMIASQQTAIFATMCAATVVASSTISNN